MVRRYAGGETCQKIAAHFGVDFAIVKRILIQHGVYEFGRKFRGRYSEDQKQEMAALYTSGLTCGAIAEQFKCDRLNVRHILIARGVEMRTHRTYPLNEQDAAVIRQRRSDGLTFADIAREMGVPPHRVLQWARRMGISNTTNRRGADSHAWKGGRTKQRQGYWHVRLEVDDPLYSMTQSNSYAPEHRVVMARSIGRPLTRDETVHHINGDRADNRLENLQLRTGNHGKGTRYVCLDCGSHNVEAAHI